MQQELINWVEALHSGKYQQGYGSFYQKHTGCYCALGILCVSNGAAPKLDEYLDNYSFCDRLVKTEPIIKMNDDDRATFSEIADYIENLYQDK